MTRTRLLIGISAAALAAGTAGAQTTTDANGNTAVRSCGTTTGTGANTCAITQTGEESRAQITQNGTSNSASISQSGDFDSSTITQNGNSNAAAHTQAGNFQTSTSTQTGDENYSRIDQGDGRNSATVRQTTTGGEAGTQNGTGTTVFDNVSIIAQGTSQIQGNAAPLTVGTSAAAGTPASTPGFGGRNNVINVTQNGTNLYSNILQAAVAGGETGPSADRNTATVTQSGTGSSTTIFQRSSGNSATVLLQGGGLETADAGTPANVSSLTQTNTTVVNDGEGGYEAGDPGANVDAGDDDDPAAGSNPTVGNTANIAIVGQGNSSTVDQNGVLNNVRVSMLNGGSGVTQADVEGRGGETIAPNRPQGNSTDIEQVGIGNQARVSSGGRTQGFGGSGNSSTITQGTAAVGGSSPTAAVIASNHSATVFQSGTLDTVRITQNDNNSGPDGDAQTGTVTGLASGANVAQRTLNSSASVTQSGTNFARVSQGGGDSGNLSATINQTDAGDETVITDEDDGDIFTPPTSTEEVIVRQNSARISQAGISNVAGVTQNAVNASATVFQRLNSSDNTATVNQGNGSSSLSLTARIEQAGTGSSAGITQTAATESTASITQSASFNSASITQDGSLHNATIVQLGSGTSETDDNDTTTTTDDVTTFYRNSVSISQTGDRHTAVARQEAGAGRSGATAPASGPTSGTYDRAAGAYSAEITIIQTGSRAEGTTTGGNSATVIQRGLGQFARIEQNGRANVASITQEAAATNAVAAITQTGNNNTYFITQNQAGQYQQVTQTGNNNTNTSVLTGGAANGGTGGITQ